MLKILVFALVAVVLAAADAQAEHTGSFTGRRGDTTTWNSDVSHGTATGSVTGPKGNTSSGSATARPAGGGSYNIDGSVTGPRDQSKNITGTVTPQ